MRKQERWYSPDRVEEGNWLEETVPPGGGSFAQPRRMSPPRTRQSPRHASPALRGTPVRPAGQPTRRDYATPTARPLAVQHAPPVPDGQFRMLEGYLQGPNMEGSPVMMTVTDAQAYALSHPAVKGFMYQARAGHIGPVWVFFKDSFRFTSAPGWTTLQVVYGEPQGTGGQRAQSPAGRRPASGSKTPSGFRDRIVRFYQAYCPQKLPSAVMTLREYQGMEESLFSSLVRMYGPEPPALPLNSNLPQGWTCVENNLGHVFYVHTPSGGKQWRKPVAGDVPPPQEPQPVVGTLPQQLSAYHPDSMPRQRTPLRAQRHHPTPSPVSPLRCGQGDAALLVGAPETETLQRLSRHLGVNGFKNQLVLSDRLGGSEQPSRANIMRGLEWLLGGATQSDRLFIFFGGGANGGALLTTDNMNVSGADIEAAINNAALPHTVRITLLLDIAPGCKVMDFPDQVDNLEQGSTVVSAPLHSSSVSPLVTVFGPTDGFPPLGAVATGFMQATEHATPQGVPVEDILEGIRTRMGPHAQCVVSCLASRRDEASPAGQPLRYQLGHVQQGAGEVPAPLSSVAAPASAAVPPPSVPVGQVSAAAPAPLSAPLGHTSAATPSPVEAPLNVGMPASQHDTVPPSSPATGALAVWPQEGLVRELHSLEQHQQQHPSSDGSAGGLRSATTAPGGGWTPQVPSITPHNTTIQADGQLDLFAPVHLTSASLAKLPVDFRSQPSDAVSATGTAPAGVGNQTRSTAELATMPQADLPSQSLLVPPPPEPSAVSPRQSDALSAGGSTAAPPQQGPGGSDMQQAVPRSASLRMPHTAASAQVVGRISPARGAGQALPPDAERPGGHVEAWPQHHPSGPSGGPVQGGDAPVAPHSQAVSQAVPESGAEYQRKLEHLQQLEGIVSQLEAGRAPPDEVLMEVLRLLK